MEYLRVLYDPPDGTAASIIANSEAILHVGSDIRTILELHHLYLPLNA